MVAQASSSPLPLRLWVLFCAACSCAGWGLSALGWLNATGYLTVVFAAVVAAAFAFYGHLFPRRLAGGKLRKRFSRLFPLAFLALFAAATLGGLLHPPSNPDGLTHRIPRLLNWLAAERWHWIENAPPAFNTRATGFEWLMAPQLALLGTDRFVFLLNVASYALLPGCLYSVLWRLGVRQKVAWHWMWLAPTGYCFLLQAGSIGNDLAGALIALAALDFALRARSSGRASEAWYSLLAAGLMTNAKASNLPLLLPWAIALLPSLRLLVIRPLRTIGIGLVAGMVSLLPNTFFNIRYIGDWSGSSIEASTFSALTPPVAFVGNALNLLAQNLVPPVFPAAPWWNTHFYRLLPPGLLAKMEAGFEPGGAHVQLQEMQLEVAAGLGAGVCVLVLVSIIALPFVRRKGRDGLTDPLWRRAVRWAAWVSLLVYMAKTGLTTSGRILAPYYSYLLPSLLVFPGHAVLVRLGWWRAVAYGVFVIAAGLLAMNPGRPLWPAGAFFSALSERRPQSGAVQKAALLYQSYSRRWDALAAVRAHVPPDVSNVGFISFVSASSIETSLWRPFGHRRIWWLRPTSTGSEIESKTIRYIIVGTDGPEAQKWGVEFAPWFERWLAENGGTIVAEEQVRLLATGEPSPWYVVKMP